jgi:mannosyl-3-phosphoglycerate phosphatase
MTGNPLIFTDLDGTLLDRNTYSFEAALPALDCLRRNAIPWILVTSKTRSEVEFWRARLGNEHPFIVENGSAVFVPQGYFSNTVRGARHSGAYEILEWGAPYEELVGDLHRASRASRCRVRGFHEMTPEEVAALCELPLEQAVMAKQREHDEPFRILDPDRASRLRFTIEAEGRRCVPGGRFWHIFAGNGKAAAVQSLSAIYADDYGAVRSIGLGDGLNDVPFLNAMTLPVVIRSSEAAELKIRVPRALVSERPGPAGWNEAVLRLIGAEDRPA